MNRVAVGDAPHLGGAARHVDDLITDDRRPRAHLHFRVEADVILYGAQHLEREDESILLRDRWRLKVDAADEPDLSSVEPYLASANDTARRVGRDVEGEGLAVERAHASEDQHTRGRGQNGGEGENADLEVVPAEGFGHA